MLTVYVTEWLSSKKNSNDVALTVTDLKKQKGGKKET